MDDAENGDGVFSGLQQKRAETGADLIVMFRPYDFNGATCGLGTLGGFASQGFLDRTSHITSTFIDFDQCGDLTMIHEVGHNMGLGHSFQQSDTGTFTCSSIPHPVAGRSPFSGIVPSVRTDFYHGEGTLECRFLARTVLRARLERLPL